MIEEFRQIISNNGYEVVICGLLSAFVGQVIKFILFTAKTHRINFKIFTTTGGMPSTHSAGVMAVSTIIGFLRGFDSIAFAIAISFSLVTMYDAAGVRRAAGKTAACLNRMMDDFYKHDIQAMGGKLKELLGHTPFEVFIGAIFGVLFAYVFHFGFILG